MKALASNEQPEEIESKEEHTVREQHTSRGRRVSFSESFDAYTTRHGRESSRK